MLNAHKNKIDHETQPNGETCQAKEHYLLHCSKYEKERKVLFKAKKITKKTANTSSP